MTPAQHQYILFHKPYGVLSQFTGQGERQTLSRYGPFPPNVYPVGRLDADSEGLLMLTDDNAVKQYMLEPRFGHPRTYWVQVEHVPTELALRQLQKGLILEGKRTKPAAARLLQKDPDLPPRPAPIRFRKNIPTAWIELTLGEGRNRQVRKMTAAVGHPTLRLVRVQIGNLSLGNLASGDSRPLTNAEREEIINLAGRYVHKKPRRAP
ncbi:MAG: pseudouridine synthase [Bacteroidota bacterium]